MARRRLPVRLLVSDLDGTVLGPDLSVRPRVLAAFGEARARGVLVTIATGRMYRSSLPLARRMGITELPLICYQGALIREQPVADGTAGRLLRHIGLAASVARDAILFTREQGLDPHVNTDDHLVMEWSEGAVRDYEGRAGIEAEFVPDLVSWLRRPVTKVIAVGTDGRPAEVLTAAREAFDGRSQATLSHPSFLEFTAPRVHKGAAVRWLARRLGVPIGATMAIGDQYNDLEMLEAAGWGVAMGGAPDEVRAAADFVTGTWEEDGAAMAIEALVLGRGSLD